MTNAYQHHLLQATIIKQLFADLHKINKLSLVSSHIHELRAYFSRNFRPRMKNPELQGFPGGVRTNPMLNSQLKSFVCEGILGKQLIKTQKGDIWPSSLLIYACCFIR